MHIFYTFVFILYVKNGYLVECESLVTYMSLMTVGILYPAFYDLIQLIKLGPIDYFAELWNFIDVLYIFGSMSNILLQLFLGPFNIYSRVMMCIIVLALTVKTFFFLRIVSSFTPIVVMLMEVVYDLRIFLLFYMILVAMLCQIYAVLGLGNDYENAG